MAARLPMDISEKEEPSPHPSAGVFDPVSSFFLTTPLPANRLYSGEVGEVREGRWQIPDKGSDHAENPVRVPTRSGVS